ncbi:MAG: DUF3237 domain-containing protein [Deltaproteobacteria bacterium]|nr:DUF3237 domain-containing protein [Deltaproteobacteria bacterium]
MSKMLFIILITVICLSLFIPFSFASEADTPTQWTEDKMLHAEHVFDANVTIGSLLNFGKSKYGERRIIPITGGTFKGPDIEGEVLPGGADWQLTRPDEDVELYARYTLKTNDGALIQVQNRVLFHMPKDGKPPYSRSVIDFEAPSESKHAWLNHAIFLGTLTMPREMPQDKPYVIIGVYKVQ